MARFHASTTPPAGSTRLRQIAARCRAVRQRTTHSHAAVAAIAVISASHANCGLKPGASLATLAATLAGTPACIAM